MSAPGPDRSARRRPGIRAVAVVGVLAALLIAGVLSHYAADSPDGLERVAEDQGIAGAAEPSATEDGPLAGYETGVGDDRLSGGLAGALGVIVVLGVTGGVVLLARRRRTAADDQRVG